MESKVKISCDDELDHVYVDVSMLNRSSSQLKQASFQEDRTQAILKNPSEYYASVVKFAIPTHNVPIFIGNPRPNDDTPPVGYNKWDQLTYNVTMEIGNPATYSTSSRLYMEYTYTGVPIPSDALATDNKVKFWMYYSFTEYKAFIASLNHAISRCWTQTKLDNPGLVGTSPPYVLLDVTTGLMGLIVPSTFRPTDNLHLTFSNDLYEKIRLSAYETNLSDLNKYARIDTRQSTTSMYGLLTGTTNFTIPTGYPGAGLSANVVYQAVSSLWSWNDLVSIVLTSNLPTLPEVISGPISDNGKATTRQIFTDFTPTVESGTELRNEVVYFPTAEYRLVNMISSTELRSIGFQYWWQDADQNLFPILLDPFDSASMKILFRKKSFNKK